MISMLRKRPWILVLGGILLFTCLTLGFVMIACRNGPVLLHS